MAGKYLMDTNSVIDYLNNKLLKSAAKKLEISVITRMELLAWHNAYAGQLAILEEFINNITIWNLDEPIILKGIEVRKNYTVKLPDAIIAVTALVGNSTQTTRNVY